MPLSVSETPLAAIAVLIASAEPVISVTAVKSTSAATAAVRALIALKSAASAEVSETVMDISSVVPFVVKSASKSATAVVEEVAVTAPVVIAAIIEISAALAGSSTLITTSALKLTPALIAAIISLAAPVRVTIDVASMAPEVLPTRVSRMAASSATSLNVEASSPNPVSPAEAYAVFISAAAPVSVVTVEASMRPVVFVSTEFKTLAARVVSVRVTASSPSASPASFCKTLVRL